MTEAWALEWMGRIVAFACVLQFVELWALRGQVGSGGVFGARAVAPGLTHCNPWLAVALGPRFYRSGVLAGGGLAGLALFAPGPAVFFGLWVVVLAAAARFRGTVCGGADAMTLIVVMACAIAYVDPTSAVGRGALYYVAVQSVLSYFLAGVAKARKNNWWSGRALSNFVAGSALQTPYRLRRALTVPVVARGGAAGVIGFELAFPVLVLVPSLTAWGLGLALAFHVGNAFVLGLSRFTLVWAATYPAILFAVW